MLERLLVGVRGLSTDLNVVPPLDDPSWRCKSSGSAESGWCWLVGVGIGLQAVESTFSHSFGSDPKVMWSFSH